jgi:HlyD family secretion protein
MTTSTLVRFGPSAGVGSLLLILAVLTGCHPTKQRPVQGYVEGEFVYVAAPAAGALQSLGVRRGEQVQAGHRLYALDRVPEQAAFDEAQRKLAMARANWEDAKKGKRPTEIESLTAQLGHAKAALEFSESSLARYEALVRSKAVAPEDMERARSVRDQNRHLVAQLQADLETARLGSRIDQIAAAEANVRANEAELAKATWDLSQKTQVAPQAGLVFDVLFYEGEWVPAGKAVVSLLPPANIKVRAFVPEPRIAAVQPGQELRVSVDGVAGSIRGKVTYIAPKAEFTPPVIYSRESRTKLVFMIELRFDLQDAVKLHPGQPVDVYLEFQP